MAIVSAGFPSPPETLRILGTRGVPACHGGFETFAERLSLDLVSRGWKVAVYCQESGTGAIRSQDWHGVERVIVPCPGHGPWSSILFDWRSMRHAVDAGGPLLTLGYNTAVFWLLPWWRGIRNVANMDGLEWKRAKWSWPVRAWFRLNEWIGSRLADHLVADHPVIENHLRSVAPRAAITMIPYGADAVSSADPARLEELGLVSDRFVLVIARLDPENSILEIVSAFSRRKRGIPLVVVGHFAPESVRYHARIRAAASDEVRFPGAIYRRDLVEALRVHCRLYLHGHQVGGTNPSLVEALGCGSPILARDNRFNRWVAGDAARWFHGEDPCADALDALLDDPAALEAARAASRGRHASGFAWEGCFSSYRSVLMDR